MLAGERTPNTEGNVMSRGVVYAIMGSPGGKYLKEALSSARSLKKYEPDIDICIVTDRPEMVPLHDAIDQLVKCDSPPKSLILRAKIDALMRSPYNKTLFLDSDTHICGPIMHMFDVLDHYDIAMTIAPRRVDPGWVTKDTDIPSWFPEFNSGVILMRKSLSTARFILEWRQMYMDYGKWNDQISLRASMHAGLAYGLSVYSMPPEYNCRILCMAQVGGKVLILHGRGDMQKVCSQINAGMGIRIYIPDHGLFRRKDWEYKGG